MLLRTPEKAFAKELVCRILHTLILTSFFLSETSAVLNLVYLLARTVLFFSISCFFQLLCYLLYAYVFPKLPIVKFYRSKAASEGSLTVTADLVAVGIKMHPNGSVFV